MLDDSELEDTKMQHVMRRTTGPEIKANAHRIAEEIREKNLTAELDELRKLPGDIVSRLRDAGVFRMNMPASWGGPEMTSPDQVEVIESLSRADGSLGWCSFIWCDSGLYSGYLDDAVARRLYPSLDMAQSGWVHPVGRAQVVDGGYRVTARWKFGSGTDWCDMLVGGCTVFDGDEPRLDKWGEPEWRVIVAPPDAYTIEDTWYTTGLRGTGSNDYRAEDLFVPEEHTFSFYEPKRDGLLWRRPDTFLRKMAGVPLGIARDAIDRGLDVLEGRIDQWTKLPARETREVQIAVARAEGLLGAARAYVYAALNAQWEKLERNEALTPKERADTVLSRQYAFHTGREVVQLMYDTVGGRAVYSSNPFDRHMRDMMTACQHVVAQKVTLARVGSLLFGMDDERFFF